MNKDRQLAISFALLVVLIATAPVFAMTSGRFAPQLITLIVAIMLLLTTSVSQKDINGSVAIFKPLTIAILLPLAWMVFQLVPLPMGTIEHPVWRSAASALQEITSGHISIDLGFTIRSLFSYLSLAVLVFVTSVLTRDRERAERVLFALCTITVFAAVELLLFRDLSVLKPGSSADGVAGPLVAMAVFGLILNAAFVIRSAERFETKGQRQPELSKTYLGMMLAGASGVFICLSALIYSATFDVLIATAFGLISLSVVVLVRRLKLRRWTIVTVCAAVIVAWGGVVTLRYTAHPNIDPLFRFTNISSADGDATLRMMSDANWTGSGVGSYQGLAAIYRDATGAPGPIAINTVTSMILEWGRIGLSFAILLLFQILIVLFRGALARGRDSFFASGAAACLVATFFESYCDASLTDTSAQVIAAIIVGLGLAQTKGRLAA